MCELDCSDSNWFCHKSTTGKTTRTDKPYWGKKGSKNWGLRLTNAAKKTGKFLRYQAKDARPVPFARKHAEELGKRLGAAQADLLVQLLGSDLGQLAQELDKLALYVGDAEEITAQDIGASCSLMAEAIVWDLTTAIACRQSPKAIAALHRLLEEGDSPHRLISLIAWQMRQVLAVGELVRAKRPDAEIRQRVKMRWDLFREVRRSANPSASYGALVMERLARANREMNLHRAGGRRVLEALVLELCT